MTENTVRWTTLLGSWALVFVVVWLLIRPTTSTPLHNPNAQPQPVTPRGDLAEDEKSTIALFREVSPSVAYITTTTSVLRSPFSFDAVEVPRGTGSGFIYDQEGHIVTNAHVIADATGAFVTLSDQSRWDAALVGSAPDIDIAVLKIDVPAERLKPIIIGASHDVQVGQKVFAIGNPFGFDQTLTTGIVSALGREIRSINGRTIRDVIQTDAAINPGNSGGPLLDSAGRLIGVNTQIASPTGANAGIGFAVPVDIVNRVVPQLIRHGRVIRPGLGIQSLPDSTAARLGLREGVLILDVMSGSAAERAGLRGTVEQPDGRIRLGDIITKIGDHAIRGMNDLLDALDRYEVGNEIQVTYVRDGKEQVAVVRLQSL